MRVRDIISRAGGARLVAQRLGVSPQGVYAWLKVPAHQCIRVARMAGLEPEAVRPDMWQDAPAWVPNSEAAVTAQPQAEIEKIG